MNTLTVAHVGGIFALLTFLHFFADWVFQSHTEAMVKHVRHGIRAKHCLIYTLICVVAIWVTVDVSLPKLATIAALLFFSHFFEDTYLPVFVWARYIRKPLEMEARATMVEFGVFASTAIGKILLIAIDQIVHILFLIPVAVILVVPEYWGLAALAGAFALTLLGSLCVFGSGLIRKPWKLWLDDQLDDPSTPNRHTPEGFLGARSTAEAIQLVEQYGMPEFMDLDHDLGGDDRVMVFLRWLSKRFPDGPVPEYRVHSENCVGRPAVDSFMSSWARSLVL